MNTLSQVRLLQLLNPALPIGSYSYSQGIEWACQQGWLHDHESVKAWVHAGLHGQLIQQELPLLLRLLRAAKIQDTVRFHHWAQVAHAYRDTKELREEDRHRARAMARLLNAMPDVDLNSVADAINLSSLAAVAWPAAHWQIDEGDLLTSYGFNWIDAQVLAAVKLVPLGQTQGQGLVYSLNQEFAMRRSEVDTFNDNDIGFSMPAQSIASMRHETQYSRLYRS